MNDVEILKAYYGFTTKEAKIYKKTVSKSTIELIKKNFEQNAKKTFYDD